MISIFTLSIALACSSKKKDDSRTEMTPTDTTEQKDSDCPPGVKTKCNVPTMTQDEISGVLQKNKECVLECVQSRQMEAIDHKMIESQCQNLCDQVYFVGQVQVAPNTEPVDLRPSDEEKEN